MHLLETHCKNPFLLQTKHLPTGSVGAYGMCKCRGCTSDCKGEEMHLLPLTPPVHTLPWVCRAGDSQASDLRCLHSLWPILIQFLLAERDKTSSAKNSCCWLLCTQTTGERSCSVPHQKSSMHCKRGKKSSAWECLFFKDNKHKLFRFKYNVFLSRCTFDPYRYQLFLFCFTSKTVGNFVLGSYLLVGERPAWCTWCNGGHTLDRSLPNPLPFFPPPVLNVSSSLLDPKFSPQSSIWPMYKPHPSSISSTTSFFLPLFLSIAWTRTAVK